MSLKGHKQKQGISCRLRFHLISSAGRFLRNMKMFGWFQRAPAAPTEEQLRVTQALIGYPSYAPPKWERYPNPEIMRAASFQYRDYFLGGTRARLEALRSFLANFEVALNLDDAGIMAVSTWLPRWADLLVGDFDDS